MILPGSEGRGEQVVRVARVTPAGPMTVYVVTGFDVESAGDCELYPMDDNGDPDTSQEPIYLLAWDAET